MSMRTQRRTPATVTKAPAENSRTRPIFFHKLNEDWIKTGMGMLNRYMSVVTFRTRSVKLLSLEAAGWQRSRCYCYHM